MPVNVYLIFIGTHGWNGKKCETKTCRSSTKDWK